jgi:hypothetical protein
MKLDQILNERWYEDEWEDEDGDYGWLPISSRENGFWFENFDSVDKHNSWFDGIGKDLYELGSEKFNKKFDDLRWEEYYFPPDWQEVVSRMPDPRKFGIDPTRPDNTDINAGKQFLDAFTDWFESEELNDNIKLEGDLRSL